ncbi:MAG: hypothetical protein NTX22_11595 [Ignavibacteriales bacterium]|nr:hypothetical protein [Ignavibacteriales bacterium]
MKKLLCVLTIAFLAQCLAQDSSYEIGWNISISTPDNSQKVSLYKNINADEPVEGYFLCTEYEKLLEGKLVEGGFNFLDPKIIGGLTESKFFRQQWVNNKFPLRDIETMTSPLDVEKAISFNICPQVEQNCTDSISLFFKYALFNLLKRNDGEYLDSDFNITIRYKLVKVPFDKTVSFDFIGKDFAPFKISLSVMKKQKTENILTIDENFVLAKEIVNSANQSKLKGAEFNLGVEFIIIDSLKQLYNKNSSTSDLLNRIKQEGMNSFNCLKNDFDKINLPANIYQCKLNFPFHLYNIQKENAYKNYMTREDIFKSEYNIILVPISYEKDILTADLFVDYKKIIPDDLPRWTPIKKRIQIQKDVGVRIDLPKENWSANFIRSGEKYEIYGYSDYEKYVNESIIINFEN